MAVWRTGPTGDGEATGRFRVWTRALGGEDDPKWAGRIHEAVHHLPNKWPEVDSVRVGLAVREAEEPVDGRFVIFLPTEMQTGSGAHINAPFYGSLDRRHIQFDEPYNRLLLDCVLDLSLDAVAGLESVEPDDAGGRAIVDILSSDEEVGDTGKSMLGLLCQRADDEVAPLHGRRLIMCDRGWTSPQKARLMPEVPDGLAIGADDWRAAAAFAVVSNGLDGRGAEGWEAFGRSAGLYNAHWERVEGDGRARGAAGAVGGDRGNVGRVHDQPAGCASVGHGVATEGWIPRMCSHRRGFSRTRTAA